MGYNVRIKESTVAIPYDVAETVLHRWKDLNKPENNHLKCGGSWGPGGKQRSYWYSWMDEDYDQTCNSAEEIIQMLGFDYEQGEDAIYITYYDSKTGQEDLFFKTVGDLIPAGQFIDWIGEDGKAWRWKFDGTRMSVHNLKLVEEEEDEDRYA